MKPVDPQSITGLWTFVSSVDWTEPWVISLVLFHVFCLFSILLLRHHANIQAVIFFPLLLVVFFSESINEWASQNWKLFSTEQYFDSQGLFISCFMSVPILFNCLIIAMMWVYYSGELMVRVKRAQLIQASKTNSTTMLQDTKKDK